MFSADDPVYTISDNVDLVVLDVGVRDGQGQYVTGLRRDDFKVYEDKRSREISHFASIDTPVSVGLVIDNSGSMRFKRPEVVMAGLAFAKVSNAQDEFFVVNFNNAVYSAMPKGTDFTDQFQVLRSALYYGQPVGQTALYDAIAYALRHLERSHREVRTLIVVSDGGDNVSHTKFAELTRLIEESRATIYTIGLLDPADHDLNPGVLRKVAAISGGEFFEPRRLEDITSVFDKISEDIRNRYTIGYAPDEVTDHRTVRTVKVIAEGANGRKLTVRTRTTYIAMPAKRSLAEQKQKE